MWKLGLLRKPRLRARATCPSSQSRSTGHEELACRHQVPIPPSPRQRTASRHWTESTWTNTTISVWRVSSTKSRRNKVSSGAPFPPAIISGFSGKNWARCLQVSRGGGADNSPLCQMLGTTKECWPNIIKTSLRYPVAEGNKKHQISMNLPGSNFITLIAASSPVLTFRA